MLLMLLSVYCTGTRYAVRGARSTFSDIFQLQSKAFQTFVGGDKRMPKQRKIAHTANLRIRIRWMCIIRRYWLYMHETTQKHLYLAYAPRMTSTCVRCDNTNDIKRTFSTPNSPGCFDWIPLLVCASPGPWMMPYSNQIDRMYCRCPWFDLRVSDKCQENSVEMPVWTVFFRCGYHFSQQILAIAKWFTVKTQFSTILALQVSSFWWTFFSIFVFRRFHTKNSLNSHYLATETRGIR